MCSGDQDDRGDYMEITGSPRSSKLSQTRAHAGEGLESVNILLTRNGFKMAERSRRPGLAARSVIINVGTPSEARPRAVRLKADPRIGRTRPNHSFLEFGHSDPRACFAGFAAIYLSERRRKEEEKKRLGDALGQGTGTEILAAILLGDARAVFGGKCKTALQICF